MIPSEHHCNSREITAAELAGQRAIVVLAPHPDDEALGCGGLLAHAFASTGAHVVQMTDGAASHPRSTQWTPERRAELRAHELLVSVRELGGTEKDITRLDLPDAGMTSQALPFLSLAQDVACLMSRLGARTLLATAPTDPHCDHQATAAIARLAARLSGARLLYYPVWSRWKVPDFRQRLAPMQEYRFDTSSVRRSKARAIAAHRSQHGEIILDDSEGFKLDPAFVQMFVEADEIFFEELAS
ncbi:MULTISPECIES: PIG-L deacetylase family protein [unclassified Salipiger]|uniref:PIG-L deacetylase family protein n=1 Tax=unclassified Salipiger TaxID=2640570 RepID=UPI0013BA6CA9|nr:MULTISPECIES: PIG-L family deacetylase [unclassified Salipiger]NDV52210.1 PIG-L family deacetylase [Salipiger sp. PrR003]NDW34282.1 PIG-L family deacetylase [Salipiger sp. PrR007]